MNPARAEQRKAITAANSSGRPRRPTGVSAVHASNTDSRLCPVRVDVALASASSRSVAVKPGSTEFTVTPSPATSSANVRRYPVTAARKLLLSTRDPCGRFTASDVIDTTRPHFRSRIPGTNARVSSTTLRSSSSLACVHASHECDIAAPVGGPPVFATRMSTRPCAAIVCATTSAMPASVARSATIAVTEAPSASSFAFAPCTEAASREQITSVHPSRANSSAAANAMPRLAPHTSATFPEMPRSISASRGDSRRSCRSSPAAAD